MNEKLIDKLENLYGGIQDMPQCSGDDCDKAVQLWDRAIARCIEILREELIKERENERTN